MRTYFLGPLFFLVSIGGIAQQSDSPAKLISQEQIGALVQEVTDAEILLATAGSASSYKVYWSDGKEDETSEVIESADGKVSRVLRQNGGLISADRNDKEERRLENLLKPGKLQSENTKGSRMQNYSLDLIQRRPPSFPSVCSGSDLA